MFCASCLCFCFSFSISSFLFMLCTNVSDKNQWQRLRAATELRFVFDWFEQIFGFWHTCHVLVPRGSSMPKSLLDMSRPPPALAVLHSAFCWLQVHMPHRRSPKICTTHVRGRCRGWLKARTGELDEWARLAGRSRQNFRAVCPFSACLSPAGHEMAAKKGLRATNFSFNWAIGAANPSPHLVVHSFQPVSWMCPVTDFWSRSYCPSASPLSASPLPDLCRLMYYEYPSSFKFTHLCILTYAHLPLRVRALRLEWIECQLLTPRSKAWPIRNVIYLAPHYGRASEGIKLIICLSIAVRVTA